MNALDIMIYFLPHTVVRDIDEYMGIRRIIEDTSDIDVIVDKNSVMWLDFDGKYDRLWGPAYISTDFIKETYDEGYTIKVIEWRRRGNLHRLDGPSKITYNLEEDDAILTEEEWWYKGQLYRFNGPTKISYRMDGSIRYQEWYQNNILSKKTCNDGKNLFTQEWYQINNMKGQRLYKNGLIIKDDLYEDGTQVESWYENGILHRQDRYHHGHLIEQYHYDKEGQLTKKELYHRGRITQRELY